MHKMSDLPCDVEEDCAPEEHYGTRINVFSAHMGKISSPAIRQSEIMSQTTSHRHGTKEGREQTVFHSTDSKFHSTDSKDSLASLGYGSCGSTGTDSLRREFDRLEINRLQESPLIDESEKPVSTVRDDEGYHEIPETQVEHERYCTQQPEYSPHCQSHEQPTAEQYFQQDDEGDTQLHIAIIQQVTYIALQIILTCPVRHWLDKQNDYRQTPLHLAAITRLWQVARPLVCQGARVDLCDHKGNTPLHIACKNGDLQMVKCLTTQCTAEEEASLNPLQQASQQIPQDLSTRNYDGYTCLHLAAIGGHRAVVNHLVLELGADINAKDGKSGRTILHHLVERNERLFVQWLMQSHRFALDLEAPTYDGCTALKLAAGRDYHDIVADLLRCGADRNTMGSEESSSSEEEEEKMDSSTEYDDFEIGGQPVSM